MSLTDRQRVVLTYIEQEYLMYGQIPTAEAAEARKVASKEFYNKCLHNKEFQEALERRDVKIPLDSAPIGVLTPLQLLVANTMLDLSDNRSEKNKLKDLGIPSSKWQAWLRDPAFQNYLRTRAEAVLGDNLHESHLALVDRVKAGDVHAIKYFNELTGRYVPNATDKVDVNAILMRVLEIIQKHVTDSGVASLIADDLLALSTINDSGSGMGNNYSGRFGVPVGVIQGSITSVETKTFPEDI